MVRSSSCPLFFAYPITFSIAHTHTHTHSLTHRVQGMVCLDILQDQWTPALNVGKVLLSLTCLLQSCNPNDPLVGSIAAQYLNDKEKHDHTARLWTKRYAR
ncbi:Ubiquitin-conjugating enzyme E2-24 kDa [Geodia barretti]|uniref:Ubiquitin-conjugating enzyme E2-24 kDa n=1 Tax=Geodia barretti TaxID=519541 RepID=A0AA35T4X7_GEOBA|nr:Ubiquitin-conjugating enzyme E2-24 kDa [Geodia barretti]